VARGRAQRAAARTMAAPKKVTVAKAADDLIAGMEDGSIRNRRGEPYKPSAIRSYRRAIELRVKPELGRYRLSDLRRANVQDLIESMLRQGQSVSTIKNTLDPLRVIYRRAIQREEVVVDPTSHLEIPTDRRRRDRVASPEEAVKLLAALPESERALWATALYLGLRRGELRALRWRDVDLDQNLIRVERALDDGERDQPGEIVSTKSLAGERDVPIPPALHRELVAHKLATGRGGDDLVFGRSATAPFIPSTVRRRARAAWQDAGLEPIALHECRHTAATVMRAAGLDSKIISAMIGHSSVVITQDRYMHVDRNHLAAAVAQLDSYLAQTG